MDERPPALAGEVFLSVWSRGARSSDSRTCLDERLGVQVTVSMRISRLPRDRWLSVRDDMLERLEDVRALIHTDSLNWNVINVASTLAARGDGITAPVGFREGLMFAGLENWKLVGPEWYSAEGKPGEQVAIVQTANFGKARLIQAIATAE